MVRKRIIGMLISGVISLSLVATSFLPFNSVNTVLAAGKSAPLGELVAYWTFDGSYNETANSMTTQLGGKQLTYIDGIYGKAAVFNGKDTYLYVKDEILNLGNSADKNNDNFTISAWVNLGDSSNKYKYLLDKGLKIDWEKNDGYCWSNPYALYFNGCEPVAELHNEFFDSSSDVETEGSSSTGYKYVEGEEWFLLTVTYDGSHVKIYHNNLLLSQSSYTDGIAFNNDELFIGVDGKLSYYFSGAVDDLRIYTKTLSYDDISDLYNKGAASNKQLVDPTKELVAYYPFDDNTADSSKFKHDAEQVAESGSIKYVTGKNGKAVAMSNGSYIRVPASNQINFENEFTISLWMKTDKKENSAPVLYRQNPSFTDSNDNDWTYNMQVDTWGNGESIRMGLSTCVYNPDDWAAETGPSVSTDLNYSDNKIKSTNWIHYTYTYKDGQMKSYIYGVLKNKSDVSDLIDIENASGDLLIGYDGDKFLSGAIDELKIYNSCLLADAVKKEAMRIDSINLSSSDAGKVAKIAKGKSVTISSVILKDGDNGNTTEIKTSDVTFKTSNKKVFTVSNSGKITGVKAGKAKLTISYGPHTKTYTITVK